MKKFLDNSKEKSALSRYSHLGMQFAISFGLPVFGGIYLDKKWGLSPLGVILGAFLGFGIALYQLIKNAQELERAMQKEEDEAKKNRD